MCSRFYPLFVFFVNPLGTVIFRYTCYNYNNNDNNNNNNNNKYSFSSGVGYAMRLILLIMWTAFQSFILRHNNNNNNKQLMNEAEYLMKNYGDRGRCYPTRP